MDIATTLRAAFVLAAAMAYVPSASAQEWPTRPVRIIEAFPAGIDLGDRKVRERVATHDLDATLGAVGEECGPAVRVRDDVGRGQEVPIWREDDRRTASGWPPA